MIDTYGSKVWPKETDCAFFPETAIIRPVNEFKMSGVH